MTPRASLALLATARAVVGAHPDQDVLATRSAWADDPAASSGPSAAFIHHVGYATQGRLGESAWPFSLDADCGEMHRIAARHHALRGRPRPGRIHLKWNQERGRFVRAGIVITAEKVYLESMDFLYKLVVFEGKATVTPIGTQRFTTTVIWSRVAAEWNIPSNGDRCVDWTELDYRAVAAQQPAKVLPFRQTATPWRRRVG